MDPLRNRFFLNTAALMLAGLLLAGCASPAASADAGTVSTPAASAVSADTAAQTAAETADSLSESAATAAETDAAAGTEEQSEENSGTAAGETGSAAFTAEYSQNISPDDIKATDSSRIGTAVYYLSDGETVTGGSYTAENDDESVFRASGHIMATVTGAEINKTAGDASSADNSSFYGQNAAVQAVDGAVLTITDSTVTATAKNATGVFAINYGVIYLADTIVNVSGGGAGGIQVANDGELYAYNCTVTSESKAAIRSDRGGGILVVDGGSYTSNGSNGCPAIYSTADITVKNAVCVSNQSRAVIIEGKNSVMLENVDITGNDRSTKSGSVYANVLLYQSASGDASVGTSVFTMTGGTMTAKSGTMFYCTNTASVINLKNVSFVYSEDGGLLTVSAGRWGKDGNNGGDCTLNAEDQTLAGDILVDGISSLSFNLTDSAYTGAINEDGTVGTVIVTLDGDSVWTLTGDSYITAFSGDLAGVETGSFHLYVNGILVK